MHRKDRVEFSELAGKTLTKIEQFDDEITFTTEQGAAYRQSHEQDCCENVYVEDIIGDLDDLIGTPIIVASEDTNSELPQKKDHHDESYTWTFYNITTQKGHVTIRWYGESNGYYSESVDLYKTK